MVIAFELDLVAFVLQKLICLTTTTTIHSLKRRRVVAKATRRLKINGLWYGMARFYSTHSCGRENSDWVLYTR